VNPESGRRSGETAAEQVLLVVTGTAREVFQTVSRTHGRDRVHVLRVGAEPPPDSLPAGWSVLRPADFSDVDALRQAYLSFLNRWPDLPLPDGRSFDLSFRRPDGYSVWWTGPGRDRHPERGTFSTLAILWCVNRAVDALGPSRILIHAGDRRVATVLASRCRSRIPYEFLSGSAEPLPDPWSGTGSWLARSLGRLLAMPLKSVVRAWRVRVRERVAPRPVRSPNAPSVLFVCESSRDIRVKDGTASVWFWKEVRAALRDLDPACEFRYRLVHRRHPWMLQPEGRALAGLRGVLPPDERHPALGAWARALPGQVADLFRYARVERSRTFRQSFAFGGADLAPLFVPELRYAVSRSVDWAQAVAAAARSLASAGEVRAMLVVKEMYPSELVTIAAARERGIPTVGVQHGSISPAHLMYTVPRGYVEGAPVPDYFAAYGEFARETVSVHGAYPASRVWITGGARFDHLVRHARDARAARAKLNLPAASRIVLVTTQSYAWFPDVVRVVLDCVARQPDWFVCVKAHPLRPKHVQLYTNILQTTGGARARLYTDTFEQLLAACDVLVSASSTTVLEAILAGRCTICVNFSAEPDPYPYAADGGSLSARTPMELRQALERAFAPDAQAQLHRDRDRFLARHAGPAAEGMAAATLARYVVELGASPRDVRQHPSRSRAAGSPTSVGGRRRSV
jgi:hypothetical protein